MRALPNNIQDAKLQAETILRNNNIDFDFSGMSDSNGLSVYFNVNGVKVRFSDHSVTNVDRIMNEVHFFFGANEFTLNQSILKLRFESGDESVEYGDIKYVRRDGKVLKAFGYKLK